MLHFPLLISRQLGPLLQGYLKFAYLGTQPPDLPSQLRYAIFCSVLFKFSLQKNPI